MRLIVPGPVAVMLALGLLAPCGTMFPVPAQARPTVEQVARLQGELLSALTANNPAAAAALMSDDLVYIDPTGAVVDKKQALKLLASGSPPRYTKIESHDTKTKLFSRLAILTGDVVYTRPPQPGVSATTVYRSTSGWAQERGAWRLVSWQVTTVPNIPQPTGDTAAAPAGTYNIDVRHVGVAFRTPHNNGFSYSIFRMNNVSGTLMWDPAHIDGSKLDVKIAANSLATNVPGFADVLTGPGYLDAASYPDITFKSTSVQWTGVTGLITGDLTIHGVTRPVQLHTQLVGAGLGTRTPILGFTAHTAFRRTDFGVGPVNPLVGDELDVSIDLEMDKAAN